MTVRPLVADDLGWVVDLAARSRSRREPFAPRFWRPAPDARQIHARYLAGLIDDPSVVALRSDHAFAFALPRNGLLLVDDADVEHPDQWATEGATLLQHLVGDSPVRFVGPVPDRERTTLAVRLGLQCKEVWWHRDLPARPPGDAGPLGTGRLVEAPPVYAPGGPVLLVTEFDDTLAEIERRAAARGAVVSVVTRDPGDGYRRTCEFYEGVLTLHSGR